MKPYKCPVCNGRGLVPFNFYDNIYYGNATIPTPDVTCRSCSGKGIISGECEKCKLERERTDGYMDILKKA